MKQTITIAVIGGTGKSGKYLVKQLLAQGYFLKMLIRNAANSQTNHPQIQAVKGDARDAGAISRLIKGCQAVMSTLGQPAGEAPIFSAATKNVIAAMREH